MTKKEAPRQAKVERKRHSPEFKQQALLRAVKDGVTTARMTLVWSLHCSTRGAPRPSNKA